MLDVSSILLYQIIASYILPTVRILGVFTSAPLFANRNITPSVKIGLGILISLIVTPSLAPVSVDLLAWLGILAIVQEFLIGLAIGFGMRVVFTAVEMTGELISMTMGLGFATFFDPNSQGHSSSISQFLSAILLLIFMGSDLHLLFLEQLVNSFNDIPLIDSGLNTKQLHSLAELGGYIFLTGLKLALPIVTALLIMSVTLGILTKAAPQLNLFGIGFPLTLMTGFGMFYLIAPYWSVSLTEILRQGLMMLDNLTHQH